MKKLTTLFPMSLLTIALMGCTENTSQNQTTTTTSPAQVSALNSSESARLATYFANMFEQDLKRSPQTQSYLGYKWDYGKWDQIDEATNDETRAIREQRLQDLQAFDESKLSELESLSLTIAKVDLQRKLANDKFRHHTYIMHQFGAVHTMVPSFLINIHKVESQQDAQDYVSRLQGTEQLFKQTIDQLKLREELGVFPPRWSYDQMIQASHNVISDSPFVESDKASTIWQDFQAKVEKLDIAAEQKAELVAQGKKALLETVKPAYELLIAELEKQRELTPAGDGVWRLPDADAWYANRLAWFTTTELNADEVHSIGLQNVERIHTAMREIMRQVKFDGTLPEFFEFMRNDEQFYYPNTDEGKAAYLVEAKALIDVMEAKLPEYFGLLPKAPMVVKQVEAFREKSAGKAFYQSPAKDGSRPGTYYANLYNTKDMPTYQMEALAYHEGIPGHHMQRAIAQELEGIPEFQKYASFTAYTEGWGLYSEELAKDMGFYSDPYSDFGRLAMELWRACRLVVDTGIHAKQWSREQAIDYLVANTPNPKNDSVKAIERYIAMPGQATAYMIGKLKIMELREFAKNALGDKFDIRGFHDQVLKNGPLPLNLLEAKIKDWVVKQQ